MEKELMKTRLQQLAPILITLIICFTCWLINHEINRYNLAIQALKMGRLK